jgi:Mg-chelatase subunit ChlD
MSAHSWLLAAVLVLAACGADPTGGGRDKSGSGALAAGISAGAGKGAASAGSGGNPFGEQADPSQPPAMRRPVSEADALVNGSCATATMQSDLLPTNILFVIDRSGSMSCNPPPTTDSVACEMQPVRANAGEPSKWEITSRTLASAIEALPGTAVVGITYFSNNDSCGVQSSPNVPLAPITAEHKRTLADSLSAVQPAGGTPIVGATILAYRELHEAALAGDIYGPEYVVLLTDGQQSDECSSTRCADAASCTALLVDEEVPKAAGPGVGIRTFVIGVPGSEPARSVLSMIAQNGGTGRDDCDPERGDCHFDMTMESDLASALAAALRAIAGQAITCELPLPVPEEGKLDLDRVNVVYTPGSGEKAEIVVRDTRAPCNAGAAGWQVAQDGQTILLCGDVCDRVRSDPGARVDVVLGCPARGPQ